MISFLNLREKYSFRYFVAYSILEGVLDGAFLINTYVFVKTLNGTSWQLSILFQVMVGLYLFSIVINELTKRIGNKKKLILYTGLITRLPLLLFLMFPQEQQQTQWYNYGFLAIFLVFYSSRMLIFPSINQFLRLTFSDDNFGKLFGYATTVKKIVIMLCTFLFGIMFDFYPYSYVYLYPVLGILGILSIGVYTYIPVKLPREEDSKQTVAKSVSVAVAKMFGLLKVNKSFARFETGFMFYGVAFMITQPLVSIFFKEVLSASYSSFGFYQFYANFIAIITLPFMGRIIHKTDPRIFGIFCFSSLFFYLLFFIGTSMWPMSFSIHTVDLYVLLVISFTFNGLFLSSMSLLYSIGSSYFCPREDAYHYQSIHLSLTGVRAIIFPMVGVWLYEYYGLYASFSLAFITLLISFVVLKVSHLKQPLPKMQRN